MARFADESSPDYVELAMEREELISYLRAIDYRKFSPMEGLLAQTEAIGDPALPTVEQMAILHWLGAAFRDWDRRVALEEPLAAELGRLKPLVTALAVTDASFLTPGAHPLHQLLDTIQLRAIGWQPRLGRLGQALQDQVRDTADTALAWFDSPATDLAAISAGMAASAEQAQARTGKMTQRTIEAEQGRIRVAESKQQAASMINASLAEYPAPARIGEFLKGPWYDSAQLVLLKFGKHSAQWESMSRTTVRLLESLQSPMADEEIAAGRRQHIFELLSQLPKELKRWLLSLQHDRDALIDSVELVEFFHSKVLREQVLDLETISPIPLHGARRHEQSPAESLNRLREGQWIILHTDSGTSLRARLVLRIEEEQQMLFTNYAGIKVLRHSFTEIAQLMAQGKITLLDAGASFSRSLARCAGVETQEDLDELTGVAAERARRKEKQRQLAAQEQAERERVERERQQREQRELQQLQRQLDLAERLRREQEEAEQLRREEVERARQLLLREKAEAKRLQVKWEDVSRRYCEQKELERRQPQLARESATENPPNATNLNLPMGTWLGFRDGDEAMLARLAVYNRERDHYIFVDRYGIKKQRLGGKQLLLMITRGLVDILEARSRFRDEVSRMQKQQ